MTTSDAPDEPTRTAALRAGLALYGAGEFHAAHDPWESVWLDLKDGGDDAPESDARDEALFHGLIQFTAAQYHARDRNWSGVDGLAKSAREHFSAVPDDYRGVDVAAVRRALDRLSADPERVERFPAPTVRHGGTASPPSRCRLMPRGVRRRRSQRSTTSTPTRSRTRRGSRARRRPSGAPGSPRCCSTSCAWTRRKNDGWCTTDCRG
ncbi:DUF309 domain-containing protein [Halobaculum halobium]|uniref:DUF309 domain-containing protein n=1 Tax=Halobaculum halobium TaxID=3032281 RepID=A0ABD5TFZ0_9EURY|nr:DUF309 domain-containing protein [Halobaculum sp. SYNS20]